MPYITSGNDAVDSMGRINISGNIIPQVWYKTVTKEFPVKSTIVMQYKPNGYPQSALPAKQASDTCPLAKQPHCRFAAVWQDFMLLPD